MAVALEFDKHRTLKFDLAAVRDLEAALDGKPLAAIIADISRLGINATVLALWAGLKHEDRALNASLVTKYLEKYLHGGGQLRPIARALDQALEETGLFRTEEDAEGNAQPEPATT